MDLAYQLLWKTQTVGEVTDVSCHELMHLLNHGRYCMIAGGASNTQLRSELDGAGYRITPAAGHHAGTSEPMFMVHDPNENDMIALAVKYQQNSVVLGEGGSQRLIFTGGTHKGQSRAGRGWSIVTSGEGSFTQIDTVDGETVRFRLEF
jgi:hypothetical protein